MTSYYLYQYQHVHLFLSIKEYYISGITLLGDTGFSVVSSLGDEPSFGLREKAYWAGSIPVER
ncbi:hypothetical protein [Peribacillus butanolivorans]|uniref:hypothetical protein n=1 Tax=Peribacillus butanolivorans TaxID=421767 RepID=UPI001145D485|nr:hypothetical protein [Peribacillus butanolivorans]